MERERREREKVAEIWKEKQMERKKEGGGEEQKV